MKRRSGQSVLRSDQLESAIRRNEAGGRRGHVARVFRVSTESPRSVATLSLMSEREDFAKSPDSEGEEKSVERNLRAITRPWSGHVPTRQPETFCAGLRDDSGSPRHSDSFHSGTVATTGHNVGLCTIDLDSPETFWNGRKHSQSESIFAF
jgi:hypothetical protein